MTRPNAHLDDKLLQTGIRLIAQNNLKSLTVRRVCRLADVNLGMFVYYFKNKETYLKALFETMRDQFIDFLEMDKTTDMNSLERLYYFHRRLTTFATKHTNLLKALFFDFSMDKKLYAYYIDSLQSFKLMLELVKQAQHDNYLRSDLSTMEIIQRLFFGGLMPILFGDSMRIFGSIEECEQYTEQDYLNRFYELIAQMEVKK